MRHFVYFFFFSEKGFTIFDNYAILIDIKRIDCNQNVSFVIVPMGNDRFESHDFRYIITPTHT